MASIAQQLVTRRRRAGDPEVRAMIEASLSLARSDLSDEEAADRLRDVALNNEVVVHKVVERLQTRRDTYVEDRAFRLLEAAERDGIVRPPDANRRELFDQERELGLMAMQDAFERLARVVPMLNVLRRSVEADPGQRLMPLLRETTKLLGPDSPGKDELAHARLASLIAMDYLSALSGDTRRGDVDTPYFVVCERPMITEVKSRRHEE
jgi:hypothetical protein